MGRYAIGVDFGTLSARALVVDVETGRELGGAVMDYPTASCRNACRMACPCRMAGRCNTQGIIWSACGASCRKRWRRRVSTRRTWWDWA